MTGVIVNTLTTLLGTLIGLLFRSKISNKITEPAMKAVGLCTVYLGISGILEGKKVMVLIISMLLGTVVGSALDIDGKLNAFGEFVSRKFGASSDGKTSLAEGFVTASLMYCVGSMAIVGSLRAGISGDNAMLFTKSMLDFVASIMLSATLGIGVALASATVFVYQGTLVILSGLIAPYLTEGITAELTCAGSLMILALGLNIAGVSKFKIANYLPALALVPVVYALAQMF